MAMTSPAHDSGGKCSPARSATLNIVSCTAPNRISAPVPALSDRYAKAKNTMYRYRASTERQFGRAVTVLRLSSRMPASRAAPATVRTVAKLAASMSPAPSASRHSTEFAAKATMAATVRNSVLVFIRGVAFLQE
jgi:hypothetical protein